MPSAAESYAGEFSGHLVPGSRPALILVDMVLAYLDPESPLFCETAAAAVLAAQRLRESAHAAGVPVIMTNVSYEPGGANGGLFYQKAPVLRVFDVGSPLGAFPPALEPGPDDWILTKQYPSAFFATGLAGTLAEHRIDTTIIAGFSTSGCVRATALDALQHGYAPFVVREACADRHPDPHEANLFDLQAKYAEVISLEAALGMIAP